MASYPIEDIDVVSLSPIHDEIINKFDCIFKDLKDFLKDDAQIQQDEAINFTHLLISKKSKTLLGYITLCNDSIRLKGKKKEEMEKIGINYKTLPSLKICRMSVHKGYVRRGLGTIMITYALKIALRMNQGAGCRFLTLEIGRAHV